MNINNRMDVVEIIEQLQIFFSKVNSYEYDPDDPTQPLSEYESYLLRLNVDRSLSWLIDKIINANLDPIAITLHSGGDQN